MKICTLYIVLPKLQLSRLGLTIVPANCQLVACSGGAIRHKYWQTVSLGSAGGVRWVLNINFNTATQVLTIPPQMTTMIKSEIQSIRVADKAGSVRFSE